MEELRGEGSPISNVYKYIYKYKGGSHERTEGSNT